MVMEIPSMPLRRRSRKIARISQNGGKNFIFAIFCIVLVIILGIAIAGLSTTLGESEGDNITVHCDEGKSAVVETNERGRVEVYCE